MNDPMIQTQQNTSTQTASTESTKKTVDLKAKFTSRKFIMSLVGVLVGILGIIGCNDNTIAVCAFIALEILSIVGYILVEGRVDASSVKMSGEAMATILELINQLKAGNKEIEIPGEDQSVSDDLLPKLNE